jgi:8-oxo-dGTP pyrophosphatase MutT (NUDIX family)
MANKKKETKILFDTERFEVVDIEGQIGFRSKTMTVAVMPYSNDENGMVKEIGILHELNHLRETGFCDTLITGTVEYEDDSLLLAATRELAEEGGITVPEDENGRWIFLGPIYPYKDSDKVIPVFAVDVTGLQIKEATGDGTDKEELSKLEMKDVSEGIASDEGLVLAAFLRLFNYMYAKSMNYV